MFGFFLRPTSRIFNLLAGKDEKKFVVGMPIQVLNLMTISSFIDPLSFKGYVYQKTSHVVISFATAKTDQTTVNVLLLIINFLIFGVFDPVNRLTSWLLNAIIVDHLF